MEVYDRINLLRKKKGITWTHLNENVEGAYHGRMTDLKNKKTTLSNSQLETVALILGTTLDYLLGNTDDPAPAGRKEGPAHISESRPLYPPEYDKLSSANKAIVDRLIADLAKNQSSE